jgi:succinyl-CoA synthetase beta subunit
MARADIIAEGIVQAHRKFRIKAPIVVRLAGSNIEEGRKILDDSGIDLIQADNLGIAAEKVVAAAAG